ncbi:MAG: XdhC family protein [Pyrinomonadaceae bacterium]
MNSEIEIWKFAAERARVGMKTAVLIVAESSGSSPGRAGFKMAVSDDRLLGSIGGGVMEVKLVQEARNAIFTSTQKPQHSKLLEQVHRKNVPNSSGMICSGSQSVISLVLAQQHLEPLDRLIHALERNTPCKLKISEDAFEISDTSDGNYNKEICLSKKGVKSFLYEETLGFKNRLCIVGGGHCALALSELATKLGFYVLLFDDRKDLNTFERNTFVDEKKIIESYEKIGDYVESGANVYVVVMTLGYKFDEIVIRQLFEKEFRYFGVLGSRAKMKAMLKKLEDSGFNKNRLGRIRTPIGININSRTPEEIAVSIAAELIAEKNCKS